MYVDNYRSICGRCLDMQLEGTLRGECLAHIGLGYLEHWVLDEHL